MNRFDDINKIGMEASEKKMKLEAAIRSGKFKQHLPPIPNNESKEGFKSSSSSSSSDEADEEDDEVAALGQPQKSNSKKISANPTLDPKRRQSVSVNKHYMALKEEELKEHNVTGFRMMVAAIIYTLMVLVLLAFDDQFYDDNPKLELSFQIIELFILFIFCVDIGARIYAFRMLYLRDKLNRIDIFIVILAIIFTILDININDRKAKAVLRLRGVFRLLRVAILIRKLDELRNSRKAKMKSEIDYSDFKSPFERTIEILTNLKECLEDQKYVKDLNYCIKHISNGKLYEIEMQEPEQLALGSLRRSRRGGILAMEENLWIRSCSSTSLPKRMSRLSGSIIILNRKSSALQNKMNITKKAKEMFENVDSLDFNIFDFMDETKGSELVILSTLLFEKHNLFKS